MTEEGQERWWIVYKQPMDDVWRLLEPVDGGSSKLGHYESFSKAAQGGMELKRRHPGVRFVVVEMYHEITLDDAGIPEMEVSDAG